MNPSLCRFLLRVCGLQILVQCGLGLFFMRAWGVFPYVQATVVVVCALAALCLLLAPKEKAPTPPPVVVAPQSYAAALQSYAALSASLGHLYQLYPTAPAPVRETRSQPIRGWRAYAWNGRVLVGAAGNEWPSAHLEAVCPNSPSSEPMICVSHLGLGDVCTCGIYGRRSLLDVMAYARIAALCSAYGTVAVDEDGNWRASEVQIDALYIVSGSLEYDLSVLRERYRVPVMRVARVDEIPGSIVSDQSEIPFRLR